MILLLKPAATAAVSGLLAMSSYITYSVRTKKHIEQNIMPPMEVLAAFQQQKQQLPSSSSSSSSSPGIAGTHVIKNFPIDVLPLLLQDVDDNIITPSSSSSSSATSDWIWIAGDEDLAIPTTAVAAAANRKKIGDRSNSDDGDDKKIQHQQEEPQPPIFRATRSGDFACLISPDGQSSALFGRLKPTAAETSSAETSREKRGRKRKTLRDLVKQKTKYLTIESNMFDRADWNYNINQCQDCTSPSRTTTIDNIIVDGSYRFCYRDYVNHEETFGLLCQRWTLIRFLFRPALAGELVISTTTTSNSNKGDSPERLCSLNEKGLMFGFIPTRIRWDGQITKSHLSDYDNTTTNTSSSSNSKDLVASIEWDRTEMRIGWKRFGTTIDRPTVAEKLRVDPWRIKLPSDDGDDVSDNFSSGDILCLLREGKGHLIFARDHCLSERPSFRRRVRRRLSRLFRRRNEREEDKEKGTATIVA